MGSCGTGVKRPAFVIAGLDPAIHLFLGRWMPGSGLGMTQRMQRYFAN
jgi:hypothetical protein